MGKMIGQSGIALTVSVLLLSGCMGNAPGASMFAKEPDFSETEQPAGALAQAPGEAESQIIDTLLERQSMLPKGSAFDEVARAALNASARASEAELRSAKLRAEAASKNWLPTLGPNISLTSMGDLVTSMLLEQVLFDNGRRKAERAFAAADVEVAAVNLSTDMNDRVYTALSLYLTSLRGTETAQLDGRALSRMREFERIVVGRVNGGVSDRADQRVVESKINGMKSSQATAQEVATTAQAELRAMTGRTFDADLPGRVSLKAPAGGVGMLSVLKAEAEAERSVADAKMKRAGLLPGVSASADISDNDVVGAIGTGLTTPLGFGTPAQTRAIEASKETAKRQVGEAEEDAARSESRLRQRLKSFQRQEVEAKQLAEQSRVTFRLFERQFEAGQRSVMDVINIYEQLVERERAHVDAKYEVILIQLELARDFGLLADGEKI
ncbi:MAG: TolC family protein [Pseudomonadota bacterium]